MCGWRWWPALRCLVSHCRKGYFVILVHQSAKRSEAVASMVVFCAGHFFWSVVCGGKAAESELAAARNDGVCCWCCERSDHTPPRPALIAPVLLRV